ncbi:methyltransferase domain-containing protein [Lysobacter korlensis]|uniref:Methyltransferase domain-containing protein n=1 Tax=Lysobacter korlensis TaxID=553636 RepID=A0ABV6RJ03_9GAMM
MAGAGRGDRDRRVLCHPVKVCLPSADITVIRHTIDAQYNSRRGGGLIDRVTVRVRRRMYEAFLGYGVEPHHSVLDVGVTSDRSHLASNYLEMWLPNKERITACGLDDASFLEDLYPGLRYVVGDGCDLPFESCSFDFVHSSAVLEHVGSAERQTKFLSELHRVARIGAFITTPNRWFPIEFHTTLPLLHWLPKRQFRSLLRMLGHVELAQERNLNLLGTDELVRLCTEAGVNHVDVRHAYLLGARSNILAFMRPRPDGDPFQAR